MSIMRQKINEKIQEIPKSRSACNGFVYYSESTNIIWKKKEQFAIFNTTAYKLNRLNNEECLMLPVVLKDKIWGEFPEEGQSGLLHVFYNKKKIRWGCCYISCGWLHTNELELTNQEIENNIVEEIIDGKNVLTTPPSGWV